jgi:hypothetical protein
MVTLVVSLFAAVWIYVAVCPMCYMDAEYPPALAKHEMVRSCDLGTVTILGDSRSGVAIAPLLMTVPTTNLSFNGGSPIEAAAVTREMLRCPKLPRLVIVSLDALHLERPDTTLWDRSAYFHLLDVRDLQALLATSTRLHDLSAFAVAGHDGLPDEVRIWLYGARFPSIYFAALVRSGVGLRYWSNWTSLATTLRERGHDAYDRWPLSDAVAPDAAITQFHPLPIVDHYFDAMLGALDAHGVDVALLEMPVNQRTFDAMSPRVLAEMRAYFEKFQQRYSHVHVVDDPVPHWPNAYFDDRFAHMNRKGAILYTARLDACLRQWFDRASADIGAGCALAP